MNSEEVPISVLAVDDVERNLLALEAVLKRPELQVLKARSGREALELLLEKPVALALIDVQMPELDGFELAELMRGSPRTRDVPIIFVTAAETSAHRTFRGYEAGAVDFIYKPLVPEILRSKVDVFVKLRRQQALLEQRLVELQAALDVNELFTAALGHDLRTPLQAIMTGLGVLQQLATQPDAQRTVARLQTSSRRMARMIEQLLDVARIRAGTLALSLSEIDLGRLADEIIGEVRQHHDCAIELRLHGSCRGLWDPVRLSQVLSNLIVNGVQHGAPDGAIRICIDGRAADEVRCSVSNTGAIAAEMLPHIFEPFRTVAGRERLGLGLYIVRDLTRRHGGDVFVHADAGMGSTTFELVLPRRPTETHDAEHPEQVQCADGA